MNFILWWNLRALHFEFCTCDAGPVVQLARTSHLQCEGHRFEPGQVHRAQLGESQAQLDHQLKLGDRAAQLPHLLLFRASL